jgi:hypothetical protein
MVSIVGGIVVGVEVLLLDEAVARDWNVDLRGSRSVRGGLRR